MWEGGYAGMLSFPQSSLPGLSSELLSDPPCPPAPAGPAPRQQYVLHQATASANKALAASVVRLCVDEPGAVVSSRQRQWRTDQPSPPLLQRPLKPWIKTKPPTKNCPPAPHRQIYPQPTPALCLLPLLRGQWLRNSSILRTAAPAHLYERSGPAPHPSHCLSL